MRAFRPRNDQNALFGIPAEKIADWCQVHITTARRWKRGEEPPHCARLVIELITTRNLGLLDPSFDGWQLQAGTLIAPDGHAYTPGDVLSTTYWRALARSYQAEQRLPRQGDWVNERWEPAKVQEV